MERPHSQSETNTENQQLKGADSSSTKGRILLIDSYDSFSLNLESLIRTETNAEVVTIHNDSLTPELLISRYLPLFDAVVIGPGPGHPENPEDVGILPHILNLDLQHPALRPIFGVCLGFQSLVLSVGGKVVRLPEPKHGQIGHIKHTGDDIFKGISPDNHFESVRYHSLHGVIPKEAPRSDNEVIPLAWVEDPTSSEKILMAGKHSRKPFWGVQYHPESICSQHGDTVISNFWQFAKEWNKNNLQNLNVNENEALELENAYQEIKKIYSIKPHPFNKALALDIPEFLAPKMHDLVYTSLDISSLTHAGDYSALLICEELKNKGLDFTLLNSAAFPGRWSIIGMLDPGETVCIKHYNEYEPDYVFLHPWQKAVDNTSYKNEVRLKLNDAHNKDGGIWSFLSSYMEPKIANYKKTDNLPPGIAFCGGLVGYISYEGAQDLHDYPSLSKLEPITPNNTRPPPDINMVDVERMILVDSQEKKAYVLSLKDKDSHSDWFVSTELLVKNALLDMNSKTKLQIPHTCRDYFSGQTTDTVSVELPDKDLYVQRILECQEELRAGNSYELCMTGQTIITMPQGVEMDPWDLYKVLYRRNPAPYSCLMDFPEAILVGASPERFMSWTSPERSEDNGGRCEFRPIKGTVKKSDGVDFEYAESILNTPKERGENLMIVDLIRHDLNNLLENVNVEKLMGVEEYKTVYQLVSVISGMLKKKTENEVSFSGFDVLVHSLPPGSMTGAPKIRSVELLRAFEDHKHRGIYSGVSGYWSVLDEGDWSVVIRSAFRYRSEVSSDGNKRQVWRIGAGGAITILSDPEEEWKEMETKLESALQAFQ